MGKNKKEEIIALGQYCINDNQHTAEVALIVKDEYHKKGIGTQMLSYLTYLAKKQGLLGFTAEVLIRNKPMQHLFEKMGFHIEKRTSENIYEMKLTF